MIDKPFVNICICQSGMIYNESGIDRRYSTLQEAVDNFSRDKQAIISSYTGAARDTSRWFIAELKAEATVERKETHTFALVQLPPPRLTARQQEGEQAAPNGPNPSYNPNEDLSF